MENDKELLQKMFDEIAEREGTPRIDLSEDDAAALPFGDGMLLHVQYRDKIPEVDFTVPLGSVPREKRAYVFEQLLEANFYWIGTRGATLAYHADMEQVVLQYQEGTAHLTAERLQGVLEGFLAVAIEWKAKLAEIVEKADAESLSAAVGSSSAAGTGGEVLMRA